METRCKVGFGMNKRVRQLAEQAGFQFNRGFYTQNQTFDVHEFAQLIINDCVNICRRELRQDDGCWENRARNSGVLSCASGIIRNLEHEME